MSCTVRLAFSFLVPSGALKICFLFFELTFNLWSLPSTGCLSIHSKRACSLRLLQEAGREFPSFAVWLISTFCPLCAELSSSNDALGLLSRSKTRTYLEKLSADLDELGLLASAPPLSF